MRTADKQIAEVLQVFDRLENLMLATLSIEACFGDPIEIIRFLRFVRPNADGCWVWQGGRAGNRYGTFWRNGSQISTHRFAYGAFKGPIPAGTEIDHVCRNKACCNPDHLEAVTRSANEQRKPSYGNQWGTFERGVAP